MVTCIAALINNGTVWMGGDGQATYGGRRMLSKELKVFTRHGFLYGVAGTPRIIQILKYSFNPPEHPARLDALEYICERWIKEFRVCIEAGGYLHKENGRERAFLELLIGYQGRLFHMDGNFSIWEQENGINVAGSGAEYALGSLFTTLPVPEMKPEDKIVLAIQSAACFDIGVGGAITIASLPVYPPLPPKSMIKTKDIPVVGNRIVKKKRIIKKKKVNHHMN